MDRRSVAVVFRKVVRHRAMNCKFANIASIALFIFCGFFSREHSVVIIRAFSSVIICTESAFLRFVFQNAQCNLQEKNPLCKQYSSEFGICENDKTSPTNGNGVRRTITLIESNSSAGFVHLRDPWHTSLTCAYHSCSLARQDWSCVVWTFFCHPEEFVCLRTRRRHTMSKTRDFMELV